MFYIKLFIFICLLSFVNVNYSYSYGDINFNDACKFYTKHVADTDVDYLDGYDVYGEPVVPAEIETHKELSFPKKFYVNLKFEQLRRLKVLTDEKTFSRALCGTN